MKNQIVIIKFGGSVITWKDSSTPKARTATIERLTKELRRVMEASPRTRFVVVHGAGSYGHPLAKKYNLKTGMKTEEQRTGFRLTTEAMLKLNALIVGIFLKHSVPAVSVVPHAFVVQSAGELKKFNTDLIERYLSLRFVPVLFGDMVLDDVQGCSILSGDTIVSYLSKKLGASKVLYISNVDGIFDQDPKINRSAKLIPQVGDKNLKDVLVALSGTQAGKGGHDVTGEMYGKLLVVHKFLRGVKVYIANGLKKGVLEGILLNKPVRSTLVYFSK